MGTISDFANDHLSFLGILVFGRYKAVLCALRRFTQRPDDINLHNNIPGLLDNCLDVDQHIINRRLRIDIYTTDVYVVTTYLGQYCTPMDRRTNFGCY